MTDRQPPEGRQHELKVWPEYFGPLFDGTKTFELRKDDRGFRVGDELWLREWFLDSGYTGRECWRLVTYVLSMDETPWDVKAPATSCSG